MLFNIYPINLLRSLSMALELSAGGISRHHWRVAMISSRIAEQMGLSNEDKHSLVYAALLHDLGAASSWKETQKLHSFNVVEDVYKHAEEGYELLKNCAQLSSLATSIRHHHDRWDGKSPSGLAEGNIPLVSRILNLADRLDVAINNNSTVSFELRPRVLSAIQERSGQIFDPELVSLLQEVVRAESFWLDLSNPHYYQNFFNEFDDHSTMRFTVEDILNIAEIFATIIDRTSSFTARHSRSVAAVAGFLAGIHGFSVQETKMIRIAGLLHDLGKMAVPNDILEKPASLTEQEFLSIKKHTYYTYRILEQIDGFKTIAEWAAFHHETLDGEGYPFRIAEEQLSLGSRITAVADVFVALTEKRPYRQYGVSCSDLKKIMQDKVANRKLDGTVVNSLLANCVDAYDLMGISDNR